MKPAQIRELTDEELQEKWDDTQKELFNLRIQKATAQLENPARIRILRRELARLNTILAERKRQGATT
jgi:large subunit ribosomal protein L29